MTSIRPGAMADSGFTSTAMCMPLPDFVLEDYQIHSPYYHLSHSMADVAEGNDVTIIGLYFAD